MKIKKFEKIKACQLFRKLTRRVYHLTKKPEFSKDFGQKIQIREGRLPHQGLRLQTKLEALPSPINITPDEGGWMLMFLCAGYPVLIIPSESSSRDSDGVKVRSLDLDYVSEAIVPCLRSIFVIHSEIQN